MNLPNNHLQEGRTAINGFLALFGGNDDDARTEAVITSGHVCVKLGVSSVTAQQVAGIMAGLLDMAASGDPEQATAAGCIVTLIQAGAFTARSTLEAAMVAALHDTSTQH